MDRNCQTYSVSVAVYHHTWIFFTGKLFLLASMEHLIKTFICIKQHKKNILFRISFLNVKVKE